jgi:hypothetical protein
VLDHPDGVGAPGSGAQRLRDECRGFRGADVQYGLVVAGLIFRRRYDLLARVSAVYDAFDLNLIVGTRVGLP